MADSLRDQLLKSGLVQKLKSEAKPPRPAENAKPPRAAEKTRPPAGSAARQTRSEMDLAAAYAQRARQEREEREREQRDAERAAREKKERKQKLSALLDGKALNAADAELPRHFPHGNKIRRVYCTKDQLAQLNRGELGVVQVAGRYLLVMRDIALQAQAIQPETLVLLCDPNEAADDDVPADLMW